MNITGFFHQLFRGKYFVFLFLIILSPNIYYVLKGTDLVSLSIIAKITFLSLCALLSIFPFLFFKSIKVYLWYGLVVVLLAPVEIIHLNLFHAPVSIGIVASILKSNTHEASELIANYALFLIGFVCVVSIYVWILVKNRAAEIMLTLKVRWFLGGLTIFLLCLFYVQQVWTNYKTTSYKSYNEILGNSLSTFNLKFYKIYPYSLIIKYAKAKEYEQQVEKYYTNTESFTFGTYRDKVDSMKEVYVVVIGETSRYDHWSLNGYSRETSPVLSKENNLISFKDFISCANLTHVSLPVLLTGIEPKEYGQFLDRKSFQQAFREGGFYTVWMSNQNLIGNSPETSSLPQIKDADTMIALHNSFDYSEGYDGNLLPYLNKVLAGDHQKLLIVLHSMGSHFRYNFRYPRAFEKFKPAFQNSFDYGLMNPSNIETIVNTYDNSILYTDWFLSEVIRALKATNSISTMLYISDHGENLCDDNRNLFFHGSPYTTQEEMHVPFLFWYSDTYEKYNLEKVNTLKENSNKKSTSVSFFSTLLHAANVHYRGEKLDLSLASPAYRIPHERIVLDPDLKPVKYD